MPPLARRSLGLSIGERRVALLGLTIVRNIAEYGNLSGFRGMTEPNALALSGLRGDASAPQLLGKQRQGRIALRQGIRRSIRIEQECDRTHRGSRGRQRIQRAKSHGRLRL